MNVPPKLVLTDFMSDIVSPSYSDSAERCRHHLVAFLQTKYGSKQFSGEQMRAMFLELERSILPDLRDADEALLDSYEKWKQQFLHHWFTKWSNVNADQKPLRLQG